MDDTGIRMWDLGRSFGGGEDETNVWILRIWVEREMWRERKELRNEIG